MSNTEQDPAELLQPPASLGSIWDQHRRAEIGLEYLEEIKIGHPYSRPETVKAAQEAILNYLRG